MTSASDSWSFADVPAESSTNLPGRSDLDTPNGLPRSIFGASRTTTGLTATASHLERHAQPVVDQRPLATLQPTQAMKEQQYEAADGRADAHLLPRVEKDGDDVNSPPSSSSRGRPARAESTTLTTLSRLFAVQAATSPTHSRQASYTMPQTCPAQYTRSIRGDRAAALPEHLYWRGLLSGKHSDIIVRAFGHEYKLHRLILDRAPFFASALSEPWLEANAKEMTVHPEDIDSSITQTAFELALKRLYGCGNFAEEDQDPVGLFATGCWLEMQDLVESSIESMLRQMTTETLSPLIRLVTSNYYGRAGDKVLASAKSMLCRDGWKMPLRFWSGIPGDIIREIVGGDGFFIDGEFDRWVLSKRLLDRKLRELAFAAGLLEPGSRRKVQKVPESAGLMAVRFDGVYRRSGNSAGRGVPDKLQKWVSLYTHPDVEPLLVLLDEGIHYLHLDFEQLQYIRSARDCLGLPVMSERVISNALWQQMELRQKVMNAREIELDLGLSVECSEDGIIEASRDTTMSIHASSSSERAKGKRKATDADDHPSEDIDSGSWDGNGRPRKFWIPSSDCNIVMGGNAEPIIATSNVSTLQRHASRLSATLQPEDVQWAADFAAVTSQPRPPLSIEVPQIQPEPTTVSYTHFPPFRFSAEFPNPRLLKEKKRVYSRTVFYAGSLWNIYIQKVASSRSKQLGVYLHRAKERETEEVIAGTAGLAQGSVDERIGQLEREMIMRSERRERRQRRRTTVGSDGLDGDDVDSSGSAGIDDSNDTSGPGSSSISRPSTIRNSLLHYRSRKRSQTDGLSSSPPTTNAKDFTDTQAPQESPNTEDDDFFDAHDSESERLAAAASHFHVPTLPPYVDARPTIRTYFKIYSPSRGGRMLSVYESAPDKFNFSQSWGWKSSTLMLDEGMMGDNDDDDRKDDMLDDAQREREGKRVGMKGRGDGKLRFMVVIGNI
ncbi:putative BTB/POZ domain-containing protein [Septoria linicola]|nr:putative BTB/POZ domain-containing protein [Septoria linicola]